MKPHLQELLTSELVFLTDIEVSREIEKKLNELPWIGTGLNWSLIPDHHEIVVRGLSADDAGELILKRTRFSSYTHAVALINPDGPALAGRAEVILKKLDCIYWLDPGEKYVFAASMRGRTLEIAYRVFLEYEHGDVIMASG